MANPLIYNLGFTEPWLSLYSVINLSLLLGCMAFTGYSAFRFPERFARPAFIVAVFSLVLYQMPLVLFSPLFSNYLPNAIWFATSIHISVLANLLWVYYTPKLNSPGNKKTDNNNHNYSPDYFRGFIFWFPIVVFSLLLGLYFYRIPFTCTALYALLADRDLTLLVREIIGKLMGRTYAPHVLNILTSAVAPIVVFLLTGRIYFDYTAKKYGRIIIWLLLFIIVIITPLISGAKGSLVPMAVALSVIGFLVVKNWKWKIIVVGSIIAIFAFMILAVKITQESGFGKGNYQFGSCVVKLGVCDRTKPLLESLRPPKSYYGLSRERIDKLGYEMTGICKIDPIIPNPLQEKFDEPMPTSIATHISGLIYRIIANPIQVVSWHYLYVSDYGAPGISGLSIAKLFSENYVSVPAKICEIYYSGEKTSACTAPTSYLFTYPAYLGILGLLLACFATICFDAVVSILIKYSAKPFRDLTVGVMTVAVVNFIVADFTTVIISHGAGLAIVILAIFMVMCMRHNPGSKKSL